MRLLHNSFMIYYALKNTISTTLDAAQLLLLQRQYVLMGEGWKCRKHLPRTEFFVNGGRGWIRDMFSFDVVVM